MPLQFAESVGNGRMLARGEIVVAQLCAQRYQMLLLDVLIHVSMLFKQLSRLGEELSRLRVYRVFRFYFILRTS